VCIAFAIGMNYVVGTELVRRYTLKSYPLYLRVIVCERSDSRYSGVDKDFRLEEVL